MTHPVMNSSPTILANKIMMLRTSFKGSFLIVEGDTDYRLFEKFIDTTSCNLEYIKGKDNVIETIKILEIRGFNGALAIVDADLEYLLGFKYKSLNLLRTDTCDIESLMLKSPALEKILTEKTDRSKLIKFLGRRNLRDILVNSAKYVGFIRYLSIKNSWFLKLSGLRFYKFINKKTLEIQKKNLVNMIISNSQNVKISVSQIQSETIKVEKQLLDPWLVCNGHDLIEILLIGYLRVFGKHIFRVKKNVFYQKLEKDDLAAYLRLAFEIQYFKQTKLFKEIRKWESNTKRYTIIIQ
ncbi:MAG: DUF4435 domain-containing protein [Candidatus Heimdallarchaeota archaeon]|nr:DUF4435 domain-containing protein [Candidatus Heimdallarchaeota archaeon]MCK4611513.1 DUF4435 domain-containing protein [Candidatus Heimdallarchaeota archaeon]